MAACACGAQRVAQRQPGLGATMAAEQRRARDLVERGDPVRVFGLGETHAQAERGIADRAGDEERVAGPRAGTRHHAAGLDFAKAVIESVSGPGVPTVSPPSSGQSKARRSSARPAQKTSSQGSVQSCGSARPSRMPVGVAALAARIGEVHAQRLARDDVRRIVGEEMDASDQHVLGDDEVVAGARRHQCCVVAQAEAAGAGERNKVAGDDLVFGGAGHQALGRAGRSSDQWRGPFGTVHSCVTAKPRRS